MWRLAAWALPVLVGLGSVRAGLAAPPRRGSLEAGAYGGYTLLSEDNQLGNAPHAAMRPGAGPMFGVRAGYGFTEALALEVEADDTLAKFKDSRLSAAFVGWRGSALWHFSAGVVRPFCLLGAGGTSTIWKEYGTEHDTDLTGHVGVGLKVDLNDRIGLRADLRYFVLDGAQARFAHNFAGSLGIWLRLGASAADMDHDGIVDSRDKCPKVAEDLDGFDDEDGCPDADNDKDGVADLQDKCPNVAEDADGFADQDGCPDPDNDGDGLADAGDKCPDQPGKAEDEGCAPADKDGDGIVDRLDKCPNEKETFNGKDDADGCPDGAETVVVAGQDIKILQKVQFEVGNATIKAQSHALLDTVAAVLTRYERLSKVAIEGHTDDQGVAVDNQTLSLQRAEAVVTYLVAKGVAPARLVAEGYGSGRPLCVYLADWLRNEAKFKKKIEACREQNRRVQFRVIEMDGKLVPAAVPPPASGPAK